MSLTYEKAAELRDAGFPQELPSDLVYAGMPPPRFPSLSELISSCGKGFISLLWLALNKK